MPLPNFIDRYSCSFEYLSPCPNLFLGFQRWAVVGVGFVMQYPSDDRRWLPPAVLANRKDSDGRQKP